jgi:hypothetical protein
MAIEQEEFKFPDETSVTDNSDDIKVEIIDDTPEEDRGRKPLPKEIVDELEKDDLEEYSDKVKKRLSQMKKVWHDERREKESAKREREEALRFAQSQVEENKKLKQRLGNGEKLFVEQATRNASAELASAKEQFKEAYEAGDAEKLAEAQEAITEAKFKIKDYERYTPSLQEEENGVQHNPEPTITPQIDVKADAWRKQNSWFGVDEEMTALALGTHEKLVKSGVDTRSDDYYRQIDKTMRKRFPENFEDASNTQGSEKPTQRRPANVVASVTRSTAPRQVRLTASQVALARKFGLTPEAYARELIKLENDNG